MTPQEPAERKLTDEEAEAMLDRLTRHFGQRVAPVSDVCSALVRWVEVMKESGYAPHVHDAFQSIRLTLFKSNLAYRLVYLGEDVRTEPCPKHKGHWSGCKFFTDDMCECASGTNITGWLPPEGGAKPDPNPPLRGVIAVPQDAAPAAATQVLPGGASQENTEEER